MRNPLLLARKILQKLGYSQPVSFVSPPRDTIVYPPPFWSCRLLAWARECALDGSLYPAGQVFGQPFPRRLLLTLCQSLPSKGEGLVADIKLPWEFSRGYDFSVRALATAELASSTPKTRDAKLRALANEMGALLREWIDYNKDPSGVNWISAMEIAIRAVNWITADVALGGWLGKSLGEIWPYWLWNHAHIIWRRLEISRRVCNHYTANVLGLYVLGSIFEDTTEGRFWKTFSAREMNATLLDQTHEDGGLRESSLPYHVLVTEMALLYMLFGGPLTAKTKQRVKRMSNLAVYAATREGGVYQIGDNDSGRIIPLDFASRHGRVPILSKLISLTIGGITEPSVEALYKDTGFWVAHRKDYSVSLGFMNDRNGHSHNDALSLCVDFDKISVVVDPGSYIYTPDPEARTRFRSIYSHNTIIVDGAEQRVLPIIRQSHDVFSALRGPFRASVDEDKESTLCVTVMHKTVAGGTVSLTRRIILNEHGVEVEDKIRCKGAHKAEWRLHINPALKVNMCEAGFHLSGDGLDQDIAVILGSGAVIRRVEPYDFSPIYGTLAPGTCCVFSVPNFADRFCLHWSIVRPT